MIFLQEKEQLIRDWKPKPLVPSFSKDNHSESKSRHVISGRVGKFVELNGKKCLNLASYNYLGFADDKDFNEVSVKTLNKYGCGSCGPRGFYGTVGK